MSTRILAVEDDEFMRIFLKDVFAVHGLKEDYDFSMVSTIREAEAELESTTPDLILMDLGLPMTAGSQPSLEEGIHLIERIRSNPNLKAMKLVVFSGYGDDETKERVTRLGVDKYLVKGEQLPGELIRDVKEVLRG